MENKTCTGFCPECGWDLAFSNLECSCKNPDCSWHCADCKKDNEKELNASNS